MPLIYLHALARLQVEMSYFESKRNSTVLSQFLRQLWKKLQDFNKIVSKKGRCLF